MISMSLSDSPTRHNETEDATQVEEGEGHGDDGRCRHTVPVQRHERDFGALQFMATSFASQVNLLYMLATMAGSDGGLLQYVKAAGLAESDDVGESHLCPFDLTVAGLPA